MSSKAARKKLKDLVEKLRKEPLKPCRIDPESQNFEKVTILKRKYGSGSANRKGDKCPNCGKCPKCGH